MGFSFTGCEIVELGLQIEKNGKEFYTELAGKTDNPEAKRIFMFLADEEDKHVQIFASLFDASCKYEPNEAYPEEYFVYMNSLASSYVFTQEGKGKELAEKVKTYEEGIDLGIGFEKESILFLEGIKKLVPESSLKLVDKLIEEEQKHLNQLCELKEGCSA